MIAALVVLATIAAPGAALDPCAFDPGRPTEAPAVFDTAAAAAYREVGDEERAAGDIVAAIVAYREALRRSPRDSRARSALAALCMDQRRPHAETEAAAPNSRFDEGLRLMESGERIQAIAAFESVRSSSATGAPAALLEGICEYELGNNQRARSLLLEAKVEPEIAGTALFFLGLIALRQGDGSNASSLFASAGAMDTRLSANASDVLRVARRDGRLVLSALTEAGVDSNVDLTPNGQSTNSGSADGSAMGAVALFARPYGLSGPYVRATGQYRQQARIAAYNLGDFTGAIGARVGQDGRYFVAEYTYDFVLLGQTAFLSAHRLLGTGRLPLGAFAIGATTFARSESFLSTGTAGYSGWRYNVEAQSEWRPSPRAGLLLGYNLGRDATQDAALGYWEHGPFAGFRLNQQGRLRLGVEGRFTSRRYDTVDPDLAVERTDRYVDGVVLGEVDVSERWMFRIVGTARRALSNVPDFQYTKLTGTIGLVYTTGVL